MSVQFQSLIQLREKLLTDDTNVIATLHTIPSLKSHIFDDEKKKTLEHVAEAIKSLTILHYLKEVNLAFRNSDPKRAEEFFQRAFEYNNDDLYDDPEVGRIIYGKMEELLGNLDIPNLGSRVFHASNASASLKLQALQAGIDYYENHWSVTVLKDLEEISLLKSEREWEKGYNTLLQRIKKRDVSPIDEDNPTILNGIVKDFIKVFDQAPESEKKHLAKAPLFPDDSNPTWTRPLNYIMFTGNHEALEKIATFLTKEDWRELGPYGSTFYHCIISGMEKNASSNNSPVQCMEMLLKEVPELKHKLNALSKSPAEYLGIVQPKLQDCCEYIQRQSGGGYSGLNPYISAQDCKGESYNETAYQYMSLVRYAEKMKDLLK